MDRAEVLKAKDLNEAFIGALKDSVISYDDMSLKPVNIDLKPPLPAKIRLYIYRVTHPVGGRTPGEHKIQLMIPGQARGEICSFDHSDGRIVVLAGYEPEFNVFILWDATFYPKFTFSRNVQVNPNTIYDALAGRIGYQKRKIRGEGTETVLAAHGSLLGEALKLRRDITLKSLIEGS